jgi:hypothetical protein
MTASTNAEGTLNQYSAEAWKASGAASSWQILTSSNAAFVAAPGVGTAPLDLSTMPPDLGFSVVIGIERLDVQELRLDKQPEKEQLPLFSREEDPLQYALLNLLTYSPEPDEPGDQDVGPELGYRFPL